MNEERTPIFTKSTDFLAWLIPMTNKFPRAHRHTITKRLVDAALNFVEALVDANQERGRYRRDYLNQADGHLDKVRLYLRLAHRWQWMSIGQYEHASRLVAELGRLLGGWYKVTRQ